MGVCLPTLTPRFTKKYCSTQLIFRKSKTFNWLTLLHWQHANSKDDKGDEIHSQVSAEINAIENMLLTVLFSGMSPTFEYLRTHRFANNDSYLKTCCCVNSEGEEQCTTKRSTENWNSC